MLPSHRKTWVWVHVIAHVKRSLTKGHTRGRMDSHRTLVCHNGLNGLFTLERITGIVGCSRRKMAGGGVTDAARGKVEKSANVVSNLRRHRVFSR